jgi:hypothetical protein
MQLGAKSLMKPFMASTGNDINHDDDDVTTDADMPLLEAADEDGDEDEDKEDEASCDDDIRNDGLSVGDQIDELDELDDDARATLLMETADVRTTLSKVSCQQVPHTACWFFRQVRQLSFSIIHSTTIVLPAWRLACKKYSLRVRILPRDVATRWNSTYDMLSVVQAYRKPVDDVTADKSLKLRKFELDSDEWQIIDDLLFVLAVNGSILLSNFAHLQWYD